MGNYFAAIPAEIPSAALERLQTNAPAALRWLHPADLHLTLAFLGPEDSSRIGALRAVLEQIPNPDLSVTLSRLRVLPRPNRFTALSFELQSGRDVIADLISTWRGPLLAAAGRPPDDRPPLPHLTVARPNRNHPEFRTREIVRWAETVPSPREPIPLRSPVLLGWSDDYHRAALKGTPRFRVLN